MAQNPIVTFEMENGSVFKAELYPEIAPNTVNNFISLVSKNFYDGIIFHRVIRGFMIQGGDPLGNGMGGSEKNIKGEFAQNGVKNPLRHVRGVISMARSSNKNGASSQFFIVHKTEKGADLNGDYASFGYVVSGMEVVNAIASVPVKNNATGTEKSTPITPVVIESVRFVKVAE